MQKAMLGYPGPGPLRLRFTMLDLSGAQFHNTWLEPQQQHSVIAMRCYLKMAPVVEWRWTRVCCEACCPLATNLKQEINQ